MRLGLILLSVCGASLVRAQPILVLPFVNQSGSENLDWIGESISETVRESLASEGALVFDRDDRLEAYRRLSLRPNATLTRASMMKVGYALDAAKIVYGRYTLTPAPNGSASRGSLRIHARIIDLKRLKLEPEFTETGALEDLAVLETRLGWQAVRLLLPPPIPSEEEFIRARPTVRVDALESYVRGLLAASLEQRHRYFTQAARLNEGYSQPCFQLGKIYWGKKEYRIAAGWLERVQRSDSHYLEAQFFLGLCRFHMGEHEAAEGAFQTVVESVPLNEVYNNLASAQMRRSLPAAIENFRKAIEGDSADPDYYFNLGYAQWKAGDFEAAAESFRAALDRNPEDAEAQSFLGRALKREPQRLGDPKTQARERLKDNYEEAAYRQLKAELAKR